MCNLCRNPPDRMAVLFVLPESPDLTALHVELEAAGYDVYIEPTFEGALSTFDQNVDRMGLLVVGDHLDDKAPTGFAHTLIHVTTEKLEHLMPVVMISSNREIQMEMVRCCCSSATVPQHLRLEVLDNLRITQPH